MATGNWKLVELQAAAFTSDTAAAGTEVDLGPYVNVGHRQISAIWAPAVTGADTDETYDCKLQEAATTVDSDFADITNGAFTQVAQETTKAFQQIFCASSKRYIRSYVTLGGTSATFQNWCAILVEPRQST